MHDMKKSKNALDGKAVKEVKKLYEACKKLGKYKIEWLQLFLNLNALGQRKTDEVLQLSKLTFFTYQ